MNTNDWRQAEGERIAKALARRDWANRVLEERVRPLSWADGGSVLAALVIGATFGQIVPSPWLGFASGTALSLAMSCFGECLRLRRRLEAALLLLRQEQPGKG